MKIDISLILAKKKIKDGLFEDAKLIYNEILKKFPKNKRAIDGITKLNEEISNKIIKAEDKSDNMLKALLSIYREGRFQDTLDLSTELLKKFPHSFIIYNIQGAANRALEKYDQAIESYKKALNIKPDYADAFNNMGYAFQGKGEVELAIKNYQRAIKIKPNYADAYYNMGNAQQINGEFSTAIHNYNQALKIKPDYASALNNMGNAQREMGDLKTAIDSYRKALNIIPNFAEAYNNIGNTYQDLGNTLTAIENYKKAIDIDPHFAEAYNNIGNSQQDLGELEAAVLSYQQAIKIKPNYLEAYNNLGNAFIKIKKNDEAIKAFTKAKSIRPDYAQALHMLSALSGETTQTAPRQYIENLFDNYAKNFDDSLVIKLKYNIPKELTNILVNDNSNLCLGSVLDLGCGTGLTGVQIKRYCEKLYGVDLSSKMLEQARKKEVYNNLTHMDITDFLKQTKLKFDCFISTDVFIYVGELSEIFYLLKSCKKKSGKLAFSTEHKEGKGFYLEKSGRYSHSKHYIEKLCEEYGFSLSYFKKTNLRNQDNTPILGGVYILNF